jgi:hypothetical protein
MDQKQLEQEVMQRAGSLLLRSMTDAPFEFYYQDVAPQVAVTADTVVKWAGKPAGSAVQTLTPEDFFQNQEIVFFNADGKRHAEPSQVQQLIATLHKLLQDVQVYLISKQNIEVFILGRTTESNYAGLKSLIAEV